MSQNRHSGTPGAASEQRLERRARLRLGGDHRPEHVCEHRRRRVRGRRDEQARGELVGPVRGPRLPGGDQLRGGGRRPDEMEARQLGRRDRGEGERGDDAEAGAARPAQRPEQVGLAIRVAGHGAAVGQRHLRGAQGIRGQPVAAAEDPQPAAEGQAGDADVRPAAGRDRDPVRRERVVDVAQPRAGPDHGGALGVLDRVQGRDVEHEPGARRRPAGEAVAAAARRHGQPRGRGERERRGGVALARAADDGLRSHVREVRDRRAARGVVARRVRQDDLAVEGVLQGAPVRDGHPVTVRDGRRRAQARRRRPVTSGCSSARTCTARRGTAGRRSAGSTPP